MGAAISSLLSSGVSVKMITGDSQETGEAIGECGSVKIIHIRENSEHVREAIS